MKTNSNNPRRRGIAGVTIIEVMIVATIFVLVATSIYRSLSNLTQFQGTTDSAVILQIEGQKALNSIVGELRTAGFFKPNTNNTLSAYNPAIWVMEPIDDTHTNWDVPYLWANEGDPRGVFGALGHTAADHAAKSGEEEFNVTREMCFVSLGSYITTTATPPVASVEWTSSMLGAQSSIILPVQWQLVSYELITDPDGINRLRRRTRPIDSATYSIGAIDSDEVLARHVEAVRFDTAQTDSSLALYTVKATIWLRKTAPSGQTVQAKVQAAIKLRNSVK
jgi:type II secretory pathway component PulJ